MKKKCIKELIAFVAQLGAAYTKNSIFNSQVGESEILYYQDEEEVELEDIIDEFGELEPSCLIEAYLGQDEEEKAIEVIKSGGDPNVMIENEPLLLHAIETYNTDLAIALLQHGADVDVKTSYGDCVLHFAVERDSIDLVKLIIEKGADVNERNRSNFTPLMCLIRGESDIKNEILETLLFANADLNIESRSGSALWMAREYSSELFEQLKSAGAKLLEPTPDDDDDDDIEE